MARLDFEFHAQPARPGKLGLGLLLAGVIAAIWVGNHWQSARDTQAGLALQIAAIEQVKPHTGKKTLSSTDGATLASQTQVAEQLRYSWAPAFEALATTRSANIALVSLEASQAKSQIKLVAEARQLADAVAFIDALQQQPGIHRAELLQHERQVADAQKPVRFNILLELSATPSSPVSSTPAEPRP